MKKLLLFLFLSPLICFSQNDVSIKALFSYNTADSVRIINNRNSLQNLYGNTGGFYFNKTQNKWRIWNGSQWVDLPFGNSSSTSFSTALGNINASGFFNFYGDSFTSDDVFPPIIANTYAYSLNNYGISGTGSVSAATQNYTHSGVTASNQNPDNISVMLMTGLNDIRRNGAKYKTIEKIKGCLNALIANTWLATAIPASSGSIARTGSWSNASISISKTTTSLTGNPLQSGAVNSTLTYQFTGPSIVIGTFNTDNVTVFSGRWSYTIDGGTPVIYNGAGKTDGISDGITNNAICQNAVVISGLNQAMHTLVITALDTNPALIDYLGTLAPTQSMVPIYVSSIPYLNSTGYAIPPNHGSVAASDSASVAMDSVVMRYPDFPVFFFNVNDFYSLANVSIDNIHPNTTGYEQVASGFLSTMKNNFITSFPYISWDRIQNISFNNGFTVNSFTNSTSNYIKKGGLQIFDTNASFIGTGSLELEYDGNSTGGFISTLNRGTSAFTPLTIRSGNMRILPNNTNGTPGQVLGLDGSSNLTYLTVGGGSPGGANTQIQFNNSGAFGGSANFTWDGALMKIVSGGTGSYSGSNITTTANSYAIQTGGTGSQMTLNTLVSAGDVTAQFNDNQTTGRLDISQQFLTLPTSGSKILFALGGGYPFTGVPFIGASTHATIKIGNLPTSSAGITSGDLWNNSGVLNVIP